MKCPICGGAELVKDRRDLPYTYKGQMTTIPAVEGEYCPACEEVVLDASEGGRVNQEMLAFNKSVNASMVDPKFIAQVRKRLKLQQREASVLFGGGVNAFSRYETGKAKPAESLVVLLRLLEKRPELINEVREIRSADSVYKEVFPKVVVGNVHVVKIAPLPKWIPNYELRPNLVDPGNLFEAGYKPTSLTPKALFTH